MIDQCPPPDSLSFIEYIEASDRYQQGFMYISTSFVIILALKLFNLSILKLKKIKSRDWRRSKMEHDTYSVFSIYIIRAVQM